MTTGEEGKIMARRGIRARLRCPRCGRLFPLTEELIQELGYRLEMPVACPDCGHLRAVSLRGGGGDAGVSVPSEETSPAPELPPSSPSRGDAACAGGPRKGVLPFRPLMPLDLPASTSGLPISNGQAEKPPFAPMAPKLAADTPVEGRAAGRRRRPWGAWWQGLSSGKQRLYVGLFVAVMAVVIFLLPVGSPTPKPDPPPPPTAGDPAQPARNR